MMTNQRGAEAMPMAEKMEEKKKGPMRLRTVRINHHYDEKGQPAGHSVEPEYEPADGDGWGMSPISSMKSAHEDHEGAMAKAVQLHHDNIKNYAGKRKAKSPVDVGVVKAGMARK
jgi:hypothetical protein